MGLITFWEIVIVHVYVWKREAFQSRFWSWYMQGQALILCGNTTFLRAGVLTPVAATAQGPQHLLTIPVCCRHLIAMLMPRAASICNSSLEMVFRFLHPLSTKRRALGDFFPPSPGQTGKINLTLVTEDTCPLPEAFFGLNRKAEAWPSENTDLSICR